MSHNKICWPSYDFYLGMAAATTVATRICCQPWDTVKPPQRHESIYLGVEVPTEKQADLAEARHMRRAPQTQSVTEWLWID